MVILYDVRQGTLVDSNEASAQALRLHVLSRSGGSRHILIAAISLRAGPHVAPSR